MAKLNPLPKRIRCPLDADYSVKAQETIDAFFVETKDYLEDKFGKSPNFEIISQELGEFNIEPQQIKQSDNRLTYLLYKDRCVAGVFERRTEFNNLEYIFFRDLNQLEISSNKNSNS